MKNSKPLRFGANGLPDIAMKGVIPTGTTVHGEVDFCGGLWVDGNVRGDLNGKEGETPVIVVNQQAFVKGHLLADHVVVYGTVSGNIEARETLFLGPTAKVKGGHVRYGELTISEGATLTGHLVCNKVAEVQVEQNDAAPRRVTKVRSTG